MYSSISTLYLFISITLFECLFTYNVLCIQVEINSLMTQLKVNFNLKIKSSKSEGFDLNCFCKALLFFCKKFIQGKNIYLSI